MGIPRLKSTLPLFLVIAAFAMPTATAAAADGERPAATPEEAVKQLAAAAEKGDFDAVLAVFAKESRESLKQMMATSMRLAKAYRAVAKAMEEQFGKVDANEVSPDLKAVFQQTEKLVAAVYQNAQVLDKRKKKGGKVVLTVQVSGEVFGEKFSRKEEFVAVMEGGGWKLIPPQRRPEEDAKRYMEFFRVQAVTLEGVAREIKAGKYQTRREATGAMAQALIKAVEGMKSDAEPEAGKEKMVPSRYPC